LFAVQKDQMTSFDPIGESPKTTPAPEKQPVSSPPKPSLAERSLKQVSRAIFIGMHLACGLAFFYPPTRGLVALLVGSYLLRMWAVTAGYHRYFAHRSYKTSRVFQFVLALLGATAMQKGPLWWASWHRRHHKYADTPGDPHSPILYGFWYAHIGWILSSKSDHADLSNVNDLVRFPELRLIERFWAVPLVGYALACFAVAGMPGLVWGFIVSTVAVSHVTFFINSIAHLWGSQRFQTKDFSRNNPVLAVLTLGEGWHNNHHYYMSSARQGFYWWEVDLSYYVLKLLAAIHVVREIREPPASVYETRNQVRRSAASLRPAMRARRIAQRATQFVPPSADASRSGDIAGRQPPLS
jgi:stearoyl-CoA desaturase (Delta-9 desaturase)